MDEQRNMKFMQIAMKHVPEAKSVLEEQGIELNMDSLQPMLTILVNVMEEAYELGKTEAKEQE